MPQWEYRKIDLNNVARKSDDIDVLNDAGERGWEMVAITANNLVYLKRIIEQQPQPPKTRAKAAASSGERKEQSKN